MRDIVLKKSSSRRSPVAPDPIEELPPVAPAASSGLASFVEKTITTVGHTAEWASRVIGQEDEQRVVEERRPLSAPPSVTRHKAKSKRERLSSAGKKLHATGKKATEHAKKTSKATKRALKTPTGKLAVLQVATIVGLIGVATHLQHNGSATRVGSQPAQALATAHYRLLPAIPNEGAPSPFKETAQSQPTDRPLSLNAWVTPWNAENIATNQATYASLSAFWVTLASDGFTVTPKADWKDWDAIASAKKDGQTLYLTVSGDPDDTYKGLADPAIQQKEINNLLQATQSHGFDGVDIDYEALGIDNRDIFTDFVHNLTTAFHAQHKLVSVTVETRIGTDVPMDWHNLGQIADEIRVMIYDYHGKSTGYPGPVAPIGWVKETLDYAERSVSADKLVIGLGNYGYDWTAPDDESGSWQGVGISFDQAMALAKEKNSPVIRVTGIDQRGYDMGSVPVFTYNDEQGKQHSVWFEDNESLQAKLSLVRQYPAKGIIFWSVGLGDKTFWQNASH